MTMVIGGNYLTLRRNAHGRDLETAFRREFHRSSQTPTLVWRGSNLSTRNRMMTAENIHCLIRRPLLFIPLA
ncbi:hypothetical protein SUGI_1223760 [Cryptomeria japonica]|uniref:Uncharacterized protein n=1 Tax=Cryptomeria japonica TaxID=3369 RepID=A0AAD3NPV5_CRYJA|nr:hypothetical protein SUGI_1223760 [Cryptomeria japonica]